MVDSVLERLEVERPDMNLYTIELAMKAETSWPSQTLDDDSEPCPIAALLPH
jgi:hypothetical protein